MKVRLPLSAGVCLLLECRRFKAVQTWRLTAGEAAKFSRGTNDRQGQCNRAPPASPGAEMQKSSSVTVFGADFQLIAAGAAIAVGHADRARDLAHDALSRAKAAGDIRLEAQALASLANIDRLCSRNRRAADAATRAALLFKSLDDLADEAIAHTSHANASIVLGRPEEAVEAALLSVELGRLAPAGIHAVVAYNALGIAYGWSGNFPAAEEALGAASGVAGRCQPPRPGYQMEVNRAWLESMRLISLRGTADLKDADAEPLQRLRALVQRCIDSESAGRAHALLDGFDGPLRAFSCLIASLLHTWSGNIGSARAALDEVHGWLKTLAFASWIQTATCWAEAEVCRTAGEHAQAHRWLVQLRERAVVIEHEQLACLSHLLASQFYSEQGEYEQAANELRALRQREQANRHEALLGRAQVVQWQLEARRVRADLGALQRESQVLERLSYEDPLTGIANRRRLQAHLSRRLDAAAGERQPLALALFDVDDFKRINDECGHDAGDLVLQRLARVLSLQLREHDIAARLGGDEFVVVFESTELAVAQQICARIAHAVAEIDWGAEGQCTRLTASIGVAQAQAGDTAESLLRRADAAMYVSKRGQQETSARDMSLKR